MAIHSMHIRAVVQNGIADIKVLIQHPMDTGLLKDAKTGQFIPAHFIRQLVASIQGKTVLEAEWGPGISRNPYLNFRVANTHPGDTVEIRWTDNLGDSDTAHTVIESAEQSPD